jgi:hypothetical protein
MGHGKCVYNAAKAASAREATTQAGSAGSCERALDPRAGARAFHPICPPAHAGLENAGDPHRSHPEWVSAGLRRVEKSGHLARLDPLSPEFLHRQYPIRHPIPYSFVCYNGTSTKSF